jgi:V-type H+-transporting ATPase proteolipid subunit
MVLASWGSAWGTWKAGVGVCSMGVDHPKGVIKNIVPIVMAGVLGIYGLIVSVIITQAISPPGGDGSNTYSLFNGYVHVRKKKQRFCWNLKLRLGECLTIDSFFVYDCLSII